MHPKLWKLTKGTVSLIRDNEADVIEAQQDGFILQGECDRGGNIIDAQGTPFTEGKPEEVDEPEEDTAPWQAGK
jgi:hypothetical protein